jgi:hypothetical protein
MIVVPAVTPVTTPVALTVAVGGLLLLHVPPAVALLKAVVCPTHTDGVPKMGVGGLLTVNVVVPLAEHIPP